MTVTVIACKYRTPVSWLIRLLCNSPYSHLGLKISDTHMIDADFGGVKRRKLPEKFDEFRVNLGCWEWKQGNRWLTMQTGKEYDFCGALGTAIYNALGWKRKNNEFENREKFTCSELVFEYFLYAGIRIMEGVDSGNFHPGHILKSIARRQHGT